MKTFSGRNPSQNEQELNQFIAFLQQHYVSSYLEIGSRHGDTFHAVMSKLPVGSFGLAVDLPGALWGNRSSRDALREAVKDLNEGGYDCHYLFGDSQAKETIDAVAKHAPFDAILIDGDHTLAGVTADWTIYRSLGSFVAFHDIVGRGQFEKVHRNPVEVPILWDQIKNQFGGVEFIAEGSKMGIGVVCSQ